MPKGQAIGAIIVCLVIGIGSFVGYQWLMQRYENLKENGVETEATIKKVFNKARVQRDAQNRVQYDPCVEYSFNDQKGNVFNGEQFISEDAKKSLHPGGTVKVTYLPGNPAENQTTQSLEWGSGGTVFVGVVYGVMGLCSIGIIVNVKNLMT